jgi:hypothetical protein
MTPAALLVAVAMVFPSPSQLLDSDNLIRNPELPAEVTELDRAALVAVGSRMELFTPDEACVLPFADEYLDLLDAEVLLCLLRDRHAELRDAPAVAEAGRLPGAALCFEVAIFNDAVAGHFRLRALWEPDRADILTAAAVECDTYHGFWLSAHGAVSPVASVADRRRCLAELRALIGRDAWDAGRLPDFAPVHLFAPR